MSQRKSGYAKRAADLYETPQWVTDALAEHVALDGVKVWEPACGTGKMVRALHRHGASITATDMIDQGFAGMAAARDFTAEETLTPSHVQAIITNPPYGPNGRTAEKFIKRGLERIPPGGFMALLLQADFDSAGGRGRLFRDCSEYAGRIVLNKRIVWFEPPPPLPGEKKPSGPSANHTWFLWHRPHIWTGAPPFTLFAPSTPEPADES